MVEAATIVQIVKTTTVPIEETKEGQEMSIEHDIHGEVEVKEQKKKIDPTQEAAHLGEANYIEEDKENEDL